jgi:hypothetical protein
MPLKGEDGLFGALETELKKAKTPLDCNALFEKASIREHAATVNRVSDYLGHLWRKGKVLRLPAPKTDRSGARWMYVWKPLKADPLPAVEEAVAMSTELNTLLRRPNIEITEEGKSIIITMPELTITIKQNR